MKYDGNYVIEGMAEIIQQFEEEYEQAKLEIDIEDAEDCEDAMLSAVEQAEQGEYLDSIMECMTFQAIHVEKIEDD